MKKTILPSSAQMREAAAPVRIYVVHFTRDYGLGMMGMMVIGAHSRDEARVIAEAEQAKEQLSYGYMTLEEVKILPADKIGLLAESHYME